MLVAARATVKCTAPTMFDMPPLSAAEPRRPNKMRKHSHPVLLHSVTHNHETATRGARQIIHRLKQNTIIKSSARAAVPRHRGPYAAQPVSGRRWHGGRGQQQVGRHGAVCPPIGGAAALNSRRGDVPAAVEISQPTLLADGLQQHSCSRNGLLWALQDSRKRNLCHDRAVVCLCELEACRAGL